MVPGRNAHVKSHPSYIKILTSAVTRIQYYLPELFDLNHLIKSMIFLIFFDYKSTFL